MTGRINYAPEAQEQLHALDAWITEKASQDVAQRFVSAILDCIDGIILFPRAAPLALAEHATTSGRACGRLPSRSER